MQQLLLKGLVNNVTHVEAYKLAKALIQFKLAFKALVEASTAVDDYDISEAYPFFLLDYETIEPAVSQWCTIHATQLLKSIPAETLNPLHAQQLPVVDVSRVLKELGG